MTTYVTCFYQDDDERGETIHNKSISSNENDEVVSEVEVRMNGCKEVSAVVPSDDVKNFSR